MNYSNTNINQLFKLIGSFSRCCYKKIETIEYIQSFESVWPNQVFNFKGSIKDLDAAISLIREKQLPEVIVFDSSFSSEEFIDKIKSKFSLSNQWTAMTINLKNPLQDVYLEGIKIKQLESKFQIDEWIRLVEIELMRGEKLDSDIFYQLNENSNCIFYGAYAGQKLVSTSMLFISENISGVYLVATGKKYRKRGIGKAITNCCLKRAKIEKCTEAHLQATALGRNVYASLGFESKGIINVFKL